MQVTVYILKCADGSYYTGLTRSGTEARARVLVPSFEARRWHASHLNMSAI